MLKKREKKRERERKKRRNARDGRKRTNLGAIVTASTGCGGKPGGEQGVAEGDASGNGVINKSVNDVSGLMLVVTRSPGGSGRWHHSASYRRISPSPRRLNRFRPGRSFDSLLSDTNKRTTSYPRSPHALISCHMREMTSSSSPLIFSARPKASICRRGIPLSYLSYLNNLRWIVYST